MRPSPSLLFRIVPHLRHAEAGNAWPSTSIQKAIDAAYYRGGTSRAVIIQPQHLPKERAKWPSIFPQIMGSGDPYGRQLDGMGAGISSLSKICLVEPYCKRTERPTRVSRSGAKSEMNDTISFEGSQEEDEYHYHLDIDYTFVGLGIETDEVDVAGNCGNMSSAIGPYAYNANLLPPQVYARGDGKVTVGIRNTNTGKLIDSTFEVVGGQAAVSGDYNIDGVTGAGSRIKLDFKNPYGSKTGKVLPTGNRVDSIAGYDMTCVDGANPAVFIRADDVGVDGTILPNDFNKLPEKLDLLERIRKAAAVAMGIARTEESVPRTIPKIGLISKSSAHSVLSGKTLKIEHTDLVMRFLSDTQPHRAIPITAALTTAVAARIPGTIVEQLLASEPVMDDAITIGHASGRLQVNATMEEEGVVPISATVYRTAKRLFEGKVFWTDRRDEQSEERQRKYGNKGSHSLGLAFVLESRGQDTSYLYKDRVIMDD
jgi:2-methylaconitate cis-trans-isomerase PrpF